MSRTEEYMKNTASNPSLPPKLPPKGQIPGRSARPPPDTPPSHADKGPPLVQRRR